MTINGVPRYNVWLQFCKVSVINKIIRVVLVARQQGVCQGRITSECQRLRLIVVFELNKKLLRAKIIIVVKRVASPRYTALKIVDCINFYGL